MGILGSQVFSNPDPDEPRVLDISGVDAERAFDALGSETARSILKTIYAEPRTAPEIRAEVGTSLQNVHYHLDRLEGADLIEPAGMGYSEKGNEMTVYAPCNEALVLFAGQDRDRSRLERVLGRVLTLYLLLATVTITVALWTRRSIDRATTATFAGSADAATESVGQGGGDAVVGLSLADPAVAFFAGGLIVLAAVTVGWTVAANR